MQMPDIQKLLSYFPIPYSNRAARSLLPSSPVLIFPFEEGKPAWNIGAKETKIIYRSDQLAVGLIAQL